MCFPFSICRLSNRFNSHLPQNLLIFTMASTRLLQTIIQTLPAKAINTASSARLFTSSSPLHQARVENALIIGSGLMGSGIAQSCATTGKFKSITLQDVSEEQLAKAHKKI